VTDVFEAADQGGTQDEAPSVLEDLVGEDKKFKTLEDLARGKLEADAFIEKLKEENAMALAELEKYGSKEEENAKVSDLIKAVQESAKQDSEGNNQMTDEDLSEKIREIMKGETEAQTRAQNRDKGNKLVLEKVSGDVEAAKIFVAERARELGISPSRLAELSEVSPDAFAKLIDSESSISSRGKVPLQDRNPQALKHSSSVETVEGRHTKAYYDRMRKELGTVKYLQNRKLQKAYLDDAMALGERFNSN
jgi:hypothetical protein